LSFARTFSIIVIPRRTRHRPCKPQCCYVFTLVFLFQDLAQAIHFHLKINGLWIYATTWEFDQNPNDLAHSNELKLEELNHHSTNEPVFHIQASNFLSKKVCEELRTHVSKLGVYSIVLMHELGPLSCNNCLLCPHSLSKFGQKLTH
ncbi:hypothetical protein ACJX0J_008848, partial [Zea mays]